VIPDTTVEVVSGGASVVRVAAIAPVPASGEIVWFEGDLRSEAERRYARERRPDYLVFANDERFVWGPVTTVGGQTRFNTTKGVPGTYQLSHRGDGLRWWSTTLTVPADGTRSARIYVFPDPAQVRAACSAPSGEPGQGQVRR
jgi:hypothetical protein